MDKIKGRFNTILFAGAIIIASLIGTEVIKKESEIFLILFIFIIIMIIVRFCLAAYIRKQQIS